MSRHSMLESDRNRAVLHADSMLAVKLLVDKECDDTKAILAQMKGKNGELDNTIRALSSMLDELKLQNEKLVKENAGVHALRKQLAEMKKMRNKCDEQLAGAMNENTSLEAKYKEVSKTYAELNDQLALLNAKLEKAQELKAYNFAVVNYKLKRSRSVPTHKAKRADRISVTFDIIDNSLAHSGSKKAYLVITDPSGSTLLMRNDKFMNRREGKEVAYSAVKEFDYNNSEQRVTINFDYDNKLKSGKYKAELFIDGSYSGKTEFVLK